MVARRKKTTGSPGKRGGRDHFTGFKLDFLNLRALAYQQSLDGNNAGQFYDKIVLDFLAKFWHDNDFAKEPAIDPPNPWDLPDDMQDPEIEGLTEADAEIRMARYNKLRKVSHFENWDFDYNTYNYLQKLSQWYHRKFKRVEASATSSASSINPFVSVLDANKSKAPRKLTPFHQYFKLHYNTRIKAEYTRRFQLAKDEYDASTDEERAANDLKAPIAVALRSEVGREFWFLESAAFREEIAVLAEEQHAQDMAEWEAIQKVPKTPQEFHQ